jgi:hypothetical protein
MAGTDGGRVRGGRRGLGRRGGAYPSSGEAPVERLAETPLVAHGRHLCEVLVHQGREDVLSAYEINSKAVQTGEQLAEIANNQVR